MAKQTRPLLSIGMIFKDEIRCLERCMKAMAPLREAIPCELVMADTGSTDGSREIAKQYADILIDFPWTNDFAAARNAVMDLCSGKWYLSIDCDEWLGGDLEALARFVKNDKQFDYGAVTIRNYKSQELEAGGAYAEFTAIRLLRMSTGLRFYGAIHERWLTPTGSYNVMLLTQLLLHHDGYVASAGQWDAEKVERNMTLLREKLAQEPDDLMLLVQCIESGQNTPEYMDYVGRAAALVEQKQAGWNKLGPAIFRYAVFAAHQRHMPELDEWIQRAETWFPDSIYTRVDVNFFAFGDRWDKKDYGECIRRGEAYLHALEDYDAGQYDLSETLVSSLLVSSPTWRQGICIFLAGSYFYEGQAEKALELLQTLDGTLLSGNQAENLLRICTQIHVKSDLNTEPLIRQMWEQLSTPKPSKEASEKRRERFFRVAIDVFSADYRANEYTKPDFRRHAYSLFSTLEEECALGTAAAVLSTDAPEVLTEKLSNVERWEEFPAPALEHALLCGVPFPLPGMTLTLELLDQIAIQLAKEGGQFLDVVRISARSIDAGLPYLVWMRSLVLAAVRVQNWENDEIGLELFKLFATVEEKFLTRYYAADMLCDDAIWSLPMMHRFGWYCYRARTAYETGNLANCAALLRTALSACPLMKRMVEFLLDIMEREEKRKISAASPELMALAEQVRGILAAYPADDPAVQALKQSPAYQKVAFLIEEPASQFTM